MARACASALILALLLASCGGEEQPAAEITVVAGPRATRLDPALASDRGAREALWLAYTPLLTYRHADGEDGSELIPGLAGDLPEVSDDGRTYSLRLRDGLEYSDGEAVRASDFEATIGRVLALGSPGARLFDGIVGARSYARFGERAAGIAGIDADDGTGSITIRLRAPDATFANALASTYGGLVPAGTPARDLGADPPPGVGPYELADVRPGRGFALERVRGFAELDLPDIPTGDLARISVRVVIDGRRRVREVLAGRADGTLGPPEARSSAEPVGDGWVTHSGSSTVYLFFNPRLAPFVDPLVREAVSAALDRGRLARLSGGELAPGCALIPPALPGYDEGLDVTHCPYGDPERPPDIEAASRLVDRVGASGSSVVVWGPNRGSARPLTTAYARVLGEVGLDPRTRLVAPAAYRAAIADRRSRAQTGVVEVSAEEPHPLELFVAAADASPAAFADPHVRRELRALRVAPDPEPPRERWVELDGYVGSPPNSYVAVIGHREPVTLVSDRIDPRSAVYVPAYGDDYSSWRLRP